MDVHLLIPMPTEGQLHEWEAGITRTIASVPIAPIRDPAFMECEPNPLVEVRTEGGRIIWSQWSDSFRRFVGLPVVSIPPPPASDT